MRISDWSSDVCSSDLLRVTDFPYRLEDDLEKAANLSALLWVQRFYQRLSTLIDCGETVLEDRFEQSFLGTKMILNGGSVALPRRNSNLPQGNSINSMLAKAIFVCLNNAWCGGAVRALDQGDGESVVEGKSVAVCVDLGGRRIIKK